MTNNPASIWRRVTLSILGAALLLTAIAAHAADAKKPVSAWEQQHTVDLEAPVTQLSPPADAAARKQAFAERHSPAAAEALAHELFALWDWGQRQSSPFPITRRLDAQKQQVAALYKEKKHQEALDAFRAYFFAKVRLLWKDEKGLTSRDFENRASRDYMIRFVDDNVALLMRNTYQAKTTKETAHLGELGALRWDWQPEGLQNPWYTPEIFEYFGATECTKLWWKFIDTQDGQYLDKWLAYLDDYHMNYRFQEELNPLNLDYGKQGLNDAESFIFAVSEIARLLPENGEGFPSTTLARVLIRQLAVIIPQSVYYNREQSNNHSCGAIHVMLGLSDFLYDFTIARVIETESRRQFEAYETLNEMADGAMPARSTHYSRHEFTENSIYIERIAARHPEWLTPQLRLEYRDRLFRRAYWYLNIFSPGGEGSDGLCGDRRNGPFSQKVNEIGDWLPDAFDNPALQAITRRIMQNQLEPDWRGTVYMVPNAPLLWEGAGTALAEPPYSSITFPYNGTTIMRSGWDARNDQYGVFLASTGRGRDGGLFRRAKNCGSLTLSAFDQWLLVNGTEKIYNYARSPIQVDGLDQFARVGLCALSRKGENNEGLTGISPWRYHHSEHFDLAESEYDGPYVDMPDHEPILYHYETQLRAVNTALKGVSHKRIVQFVKQHGVWVVLDVMESGKPHTYRQQWWVPKLTGKQPHGYTEEQFAVDQAGQAIRSHAADKVNLSMIHAGQALTYEPVKTYVKQEEWYKGYRSDRTPGIEFLHLTADWKAAAGRSQLITVIYPRKSIDDDIAVVRADDGTRVSVTLKSGTSIEFSAKGMETELTVTESDGSRRGLIVSNGESYEFEGAATRVPIYRPIRDITISPDIAGFIDEVNVRMTCPTDGVDIRYTVDGSDPDLGATLYTGELAFDGSVALKARAFRKGMTVMPPDLATGTLMTRVFRADFTREQPLEPLPEQYAKDLKPGLTFRYYEDQWPKLLYGAPLSKELKRGRVAKLFDISPRSGQAGQAFAFRYEGYIEVPEDGLYTIYAPEEFTHYAPLAGYDLNVELGYRNDWYGGKKRDVGPGKPLQEWYPVTRRHAFGTWSVHLKKGHHPIRVYYADIRPGGFLEYMQFKYDGTNVPGLIKRYWDGDVPELQISGPRLPRQPLPAQWLQAKE
jgi:hypothetical protein